MKDEPGAQPRAEFKKCIAFCIAEHLHRVSDEDRICSDIVCDTWPLIIVADGASVQEDASGKSLMGKGGRAAEQASNAAREYLKDRLPDLESIEEVLLCLREMYDHVFKSLRKTETPGATTLLVALLWESKKDGTLFWCYAYEGDGFIDLLSPARKIESVVRAERLLSPQKVEETATVGSERITVPPAFGCRLYEPGDLIYIASDGIIPLDSWLRKEHRKTLPHFILSQFRNSEELKKVLSECPNYTDDAVLGIIWTEERRDRSNC